MSGSRQQKRGIPFVSPRLAPDHLLILLLRSCRFEMLAVSFSETQVKGLQTPALSLVLFPFSSPSSYFSHFPFHFTSAASNTAGVQYLVLAVIVSVP